MKTNLFRALPLAIYCLVFLNLSSIQAQENNLKKFTLGTQFQQVQGDLGFGIHLLTPGFLGGFRVKNSYNRNYVFHPDNQGSTTTSAYWNMNFGTRYQFVVVENINFYVEAGSQMLINPSTVSSEQFNFGGYGLAGMEIFISENLNKNLSFFLEMGGAGNNSRADKLPTQPKLATGFHASVGVAYSIRIKKSKQKNNENN